MEYLAKDLQPGVTYAVQIRSLSGSDISDWSPVFNIVTASDSSMPGNVTGLVGTVVGTSFSLSWTAATKNTDGTPFLDFKDYQITISDNFDNTHVRYSPNNKFVYTLDMNKADFGDPVGKLKFIVQARDTTNNVSPLTRTINLQNPPPQDVPSLASAPQVGGVQLSWSPVSDADIYGYNLYADTDPSFVPSADNMIFTGKTLNYFYSTSSTAAQYFKIVAVDVFGQTSVTPTISNTIPTTVPVSDHDTHTFTYSGPVALLTGTQRLYFDANYTIVSVRASVGTAPTGADIKVDVKVNGTSIWSYTPADAPVIADGAYTSGAVVNIDSPTIASGDYITVDITQIGSTTPGSDLTLSIRVAAT